MLTPFHSIKAAAQTSPYLTLTKTNLGHGATTYTASVAADELTTSSESSATRPTTAPPAGGDRVLSKQQRVLFDALTGIGERRIGSQLGRRYVGALSALSSPSNPDHLAQAGHSLREMMDLLPEAVDVPVKELRERISDKAAPLEGAWRAAQNSGCRQDGKWVGEIDKHLRKFLVAADKFYTWLAKHQFTRRTRFDSVLVGLDVSGKPPPKGLRDLNVLEWIDMHDYFVKAAHHSDGIDLSEFEGYVSALEKTMLDLLVPRTFEGFDAIDAILAEEEGDA